MSTNSNTLTVLDKFNLTDQLYDDLCLTYGKHRVDREISLELESKENAFNSFMSKRSKAIESGALPTLGATKVLLTEAIPVLSKAISDWFDKVNTGKPGKRHIAAGLCNQLTPDALSFITLRVLLEHGVHGVTLTKIASLVGEAIETEIRYNTILNTLDQQEVARFKSGLDKRISFQFKKRYMLSLENHLADEKRLAKWNKYSNEQKVQMGLKLVDLFIISTGLAFLEKMVTGANQTVYMLRIDLDVINYIEHQDLEMATLLFQHRPMVIPPRPWTSPFEGGYWINLKEPIKLVRASSSTNSSVYADVDMPNVYKAVNAIQSTAWRINRRVLEVANEVTNWKHIPEGLEMPLAEPAEPPVRPIEADTNDEVQREWRSRMVHYYQDDNKRKSKRYLINGTLAMANTYKEDQAIYFPHNLDFRGRVYPLTTLSPQGTDFVKALLEFSEGVPLGTNGHVWLAFQGANCYGLDKKPMEDRIAWVYQNTDLILSIANNPLDDLRWCDTDSPWEFLAFCFEWKDYLEQGDSYVSRLPVAFDGSCSGLQHFSAMLRDEIGGSAVNLVPNNQVQDIYGIVAKKVIEMLKKDLVEGTVDEVKTTKDGNSEYISKGTKSLAKEWLDYGVTRKVTKRPTMTLCYGASRYGFTEQVLEDTVYPALNHNPIAFSKPSQSAKYMAGLIWEALKGVVVKAVEAMEWLQTASGLLAGDKDINGNNLPTFWITPAGFPVKQQYNKYTRVQLKTFVSGNIKVRSTVGDCKDECITEGSAIKPAFRRELPEIDTRKQKQGIAPNYVHSMDASHLMLTVCACVDKGVTAFAMIHDSYGCPAGHGDIMFNTVREVFVDTYTKNDVLQDLHDHVQNLLSAKVVEKLPEVPSKGNLDLDLVKQSMYAFS